MKHTGLHNQFPTERDVNPTQFDELLKTWRVVLQDYFSDTNKLVFSVPSIVHDLDYPGIYTALHDALGHHELVYDHQMPYLSHSFWRLLKPIFCPKYTANERIEPFSGQLIHYQKLNTIISKIKPSVQRSCNVYTLDAFESLLSQWTSDTQLVIQYHPSVHRQKHLVKVGQAIQSSDHDILTLKMTINTVTRHIQRMEKDVEALNNQVVLHKSNKQRCLFLLRKRKLLTAHISQKYDTLHNLETLLHRIDQCDSDHQIVEAYRLGASLIKTTLKDYELTPERIEETLDTVKDSFDMYDEVMDAMPSVDMEELAQLETEFNDIKLPDVPNSEIEETQFTKIAAE